MGAACTKSGRAETAFLKAAKDGDCAAVQEAMYRNVEWAHKAQTWNCQTVFHVAARYGRLDVLETVVEAVRLNPAGPDKWQKLLRFGHSTDSILRAFVNLQDARCQTSLHIACIYGHAGVATALLKLGSSPWTWDELGGRTPLHYAASMGHVECIQAILSHNAPQPTGEALRRPNTSRTKLVDICNDSGYTPLHYAVWAGNTASIRALVSYEASLSARNVACGSDWVVSCLKCTPLHLAAHKGNPAVVKLLLSAYVQSQVPPGTEVPPGAEQRRRRDPRRHVNANRQLPYHVAIARHHGNLAELLHPDVPFSFILTPAEMESAARMYGVPKLAVLAATALQRKLVAEIDLAMAAVRGPGGKKLGSVSSTGMGAAGGGGGGAGPLAQLGGVASGAVSRAPSGSLVALSAAVLAGARQMAASRENSVRGGTGAAEALGRREERAGEGAGGGVGGAGAQQAADGGRQEDGGEVTLAVGMGPGAGEAPADGERAAGKGLAALPSPRGSAAAAALAGSNGHGSSSPRRASRLGAGPMSPTAAAAAREQQAGMRRASDGSPFGAASGRGSHDAPAPPFVGDSAYGAAAAAAGAAAAAPKGGVGGSGGTGSGSSCSGDHSASSSPPSGLCSSHCDKDPSALPPISELPPHYGKTSEALPLPPAPISPFLAPSFQAAGAPPAGAAAASPPGALRPAASAASPAGAGAGDANAASTEGGRAAASMHHAASAFARFAAEPFDEALVAAAAAAANGGGGGGAGAAGAPAPLPTEASGLGAGGAGGASAAPRQSGTDRPAAISLAALTRVKSKDGRVQAPAAGAVAPAPGAAAGLQPAGSASVRRSRSLRSLWASAAGAVTGAAARQRRTLTQNAVNNAAYQPHAPGLAPNANPSVHNAALLSGGAEAAATGGAAMRGRGGDDDDEDDILLALHPHDPTDAAVAAVMACDPSNHPGAAATGPRVAHPAGSVDPSTRAELPPLVGAAGGALAGRTLTGTAAAAAGERTFSAGAPLTPRMSGEAPPARASRGVGLAFWRRTNTRQGSATNLADASPRAEPGPATPLPLRDARASQGGTPSPLPGASPGDHAGQHVLSGVLPRGVVGPDDGPVSGAGLRRVSPGGLDVSVRAALLAGGAGAAGANLEAAVSHMVGAGLGDGGGTHAQQVLRRARLLQLTQGLDLQDLLREHADLAQAVAAASNAGGAVAPSGAAGAAGGGQGLARTRSDAPTVLGGAAGGGGALAAPPMLGRGEGHAAGSASMRCGVSGAGAGGEGLPLGGAGAAGAGPGAAPPASGGYRITWSGAEAGRSRRLMQAAAAPAAAGATGTRMAAPPVGAHGHGDADDDADDSMEELPHALPEAGVYAAATAAAAAALGASLDPPAPTLATGSAAPAAAEGGSVRGAGPPPASRGVSQDALAAADSAACDPAPAGAPAAQVPSSPAPPARQLSLRQAPAGAGPSPAVELLLRRVSSRLESDAGDRVCGVCFDQPNVLAITGCNHRLCADCSRELCQLNTFKPALCPFCRGYIGGFTYVKV